MSHVTIDGKGERVCDWRKKYLLEENSIQGYLSDFEKTIALFLEWRKARPFLFVCQCPYATALVLSSIEFLEKAHHLGLTIIQGCSISLLIKFLYRLLTQPPHCPHGKAPLRRGLFFFYICGILVLTP
jgi:hypothetical protein